MLGPMRICHLRRESTLPYVNSSKAAIVVDGAIHSTPFAETWSCYKGGERLCGRCGTCIERREAFHLAGHIDPIEQEDPNFQSEAVRRYSVEEVRWCTGSPRNSISRRRISCATCPLITSVQGSVGIITSWLSSLRLPSSTPTALSGSSATFRS